MMLFTSIDIQKKAAVWFEIQLFLFDFNQTISATNNICCMLENVYVTRVVNIYSRYF